MDALHDLSGTHNAQCWLLAHAAATATESNIVFVAPFTCTLTKVTFFPSAAITGADTNETNLNLINRGTNGAGTTELKNYDFVNGKDGPVAGVDLTPAETALARGSVVVVQHEKVGTGLAIPSGMLVLEYRGS